MMTEEQMDIEKIAKRASELFKKFGVRYPVLDAMMDIEAAHADIPLDLQRLKNADAFNFSHDVAGIRTNLNRKTRKIENCFVPRFAKPDAVKPVTCNLCGRVHSDGTANNCQ